MVIFTENDTCVNGNKKIERPGIAYSDYIMEIDSGIYTGLFEVKNSRSDDMSIGVGLYDKLKNEHFWSEFVCKQIDFSKNSLTKRSLDSNMDQKYFDDMYIHDKPVSMFIWSLCLDTATLDISHCFDKESDDSDSDFSSDDSFLPTETLDMKKEILEIKLDTNGLIELSFKDFQRKLSSSKNVSSQ